MSPVEGVFLRLTGLAWSGRPSVEEYRAAFNKLSVLLLSNDQPGASLPVLLGCSGNEWNSLDEKEKNRLWKRCSIIVHPDKAGGGDERKNTATGY